MPVMLAAGAPTCQLWFRRVWRGAGQVASAEEFVEFAEVDVPAAAAHGVPAVR